MLLGTPNEPILLSMVAADGRTDLYGRARVYDASGVLSIAVPLVHVAEGLYSALHTPTAEGYYNVVYEFFFDNAYTASAGYEKQGEALDVSSIRTNVLRLLGFAHENAIIDNQVYDAENNLLGARIRVYDTNANAVSAAAIAPTPYMVGLRYIYEVHASYTGGLLSKYYMTRLQ